MRLLPTVLLLSTFCVGLTAQVPADASAKAAPASQAAEKFKALGTKQTERMKGMQRGDSKAREEMLAARTQDLEGFVKEFPKTSEASKARIELAQLAAAQKLDDKKTHWLDEAVANATTIDDRMELVLTLKAGFKDDERADKVLAAAEAAAKTDEDKAAILMGKATLTRRADPKNKAPYQEALGELVKTYPNTKVGKVAASKLQAANLKEGSDPVAFTTKDLDGKSVSPADYKGKVLLIDFWATWCGPCMKELPNVLATYEEYHTQGFEILGVSLDRDGDLEKLKATIKDKNMAWRHVYDGKYWNAEIAVLHDIQSIPATILIGRDGKVIGTNLRGEKLGPAVKAALEAK
jgi:peroxiredoxin